MRWITQFDSYGFRLLAPGSILLFFALIAYLEKRASKAFFGAFKILLVSFALLSWVKNVPYECLAMSKSQNYPETAQMIVEKYSTVEKNSVIVFAEDHLRYLRIDLQLREPYAFPYQATQENWHSFIERINPEYNKQVYLNTLMSKNNKEYDKTVADKLNDYEPNVLVKIL